MLPSVSSSKKKEGEAPVMKICVTFASNQALQYAVQMEAGEASEVAKVECVYGELPSHKMEVRGVAMSATDNYFATNSFDSVKVWNVDLHTAQSGNGLNIECKQSLEEPNVLSMAILPGNKYLCLGTKDG